MSILGSTFSGSSSLFGNAGGVTSSAAPQPSSMFGSTANNQPSSTSSLFGTSLPTNTAGNTAQTSAPSSAPSLFGNTGSESTTGGGLFGRITSGPTTSSAGGGLFDRASGGANPTTAGASPFGQSTASQPQNTSLFAQTSSTPPQSTSLFGQTTAAAQTQSSLFGQAASVPQAQSSSLFGQQPISTNTLSQSQTTINGNGAQQSRSNGGPRAAMFEDLLERGRKRHDFSRDAQAQSEQLPALQLSLGDISSKIRGLGSVKPDFGASREHDSRANYLLAASGVPQGATRRDLDAFAARSGPATQQAPAAFDPDMDAYMNSLHAKTTMELLNESMEQSRRDFDVFIEDNIQINWSEQRRKMYAHFGLVKPEEDGGLASSSMGLGPTERGAFGRSSRRARGVDSIASPASRSTFGRSSASRSILGGSVQRTSVRPQNLFPDIAEKSAGGEQNTALGDAFLRSKQERYIEKVKELNMNRLQRLCYPLAQEFARVELESGSDTPKHLVDAYRALKEIVGEPIGVDHPSDAGAVKQRQFAKDYLDDTPNSGPSMSIRRRILDGSRRFLEDDFFRQLETVVDRNAREADIGGRPTKISKVRGYVRIRANRKDLGSDTAQLQQMGGDYVWVLLFHLLRCGLVQEAARYCVENENAISAMDRFFPTYIQLYAKHDRSIPVKERMSMNRTYQQRSLQPENTIDPYRMACYKVMGRCEMHRKNLEGINQTVDDLIWLYFVLARESNRAEETAGEVFGLDEVRNLVEDIGERHFTSSTDPGSSYSVYFLMQVLSGMFEKAVEWLFRFNYIAAVHFAIALDYYGLLRVADFSVGAENLLSYTTREKPQISFGRLIGYYTRDFRLARAEAATDYLILVCLNDDLPGQSGRSHARMCHEALKELVLETREFALLLGDVRGDGKRIPGAIEQRLPLFAGEGLEDADFLRSLTIQAAATADDSDRTTDAALLYHLADDYESVVSIINRSLSDALSVSIGEEQLRLQPLKPRATAPEVTNTNEENNQKSLSLTSISDAAELARSMIALYDDNGLVLQKIRRETIDTAHVLIHMSMIKDSVVQGRWAQALDQIKELDFVPLEAQGNITTIRFAAQRLNNLHPVVARNIGPLLIWAITACGQQRKLVQNSLFEGTRNAVVEQLAASARDLMVYAGLIRYKLPSDTFEMLARAGQDVEA